MTRALAAASLALALVACGGDGPSRTGDRPPVATLIAQNVELLPGDDAALRIAFEPYEGAAQVIVASTPPTAATVCPLRALDEPLPARARCRRDIGSGVREPVGMRDMGAIAITIDGGASVRANIRVEFEEAGRDVAIAMPVIRPPAGARDCADNACTPFFELVPTRGGPFGARATWTGPAGALELLQGGVLGRAETATGLRYAVPARADGVSPLRISTTLSAPGEYALVLRQDALGPGATPMRDVRLEVEWPPTER